MKARIVNVLFVDIPRGYKIGDIIDVVYNHEIKLYTDSTGYNFLSSQLEIIDESKDEIVERVLRRFNERSQVGIKKYSTTLERNDLSVLEWLQHLQDELMDATLYVERLKDEQLVINKNK